MSIKDKKLYIIVFLGLDLFIVAWGAMAGPNEMPYWIRLLAINSVGVMLGAAVGGIWADKRKSD